MTSTSCGFKYIAKNENSASAISKIQKNPKIYRLAEFISYTYNFAPSKLEDNNVLEELFMNSSSSNDKLNKKNNKSEINFKSASTNTTVD